MKRLMTDFELIRKFPKCHTVHCSHYPEMGCEVYAARLADAYEDAEFEGVASEKLENIFADVLVEV